MIAVCAHFCLFFFSSRRRHTRLQGDWSSDVCSSDLVSLHYYPRRARVYGIDLSGGMLREARKKIVERRMENVAVFQADALCLPFADDRDRKSTRLNSSHLVNSYAVFCLEKKKLGDTH